MKEARRFAPPRLRAALTAACVLALLAGCDRGGTGKAPAAPAKIDAPTIVLVSIDTLRADRIGCYGKAGAGTPNIDRLAAEGVRFASAQTTAPLTLPAHASLLSGRTVPAHGVRNNGTYRVPDDLPLAAERFAKAGYATAAFVSAPVLARRYGLDRGFEIYDDAIRPPPRQQGLVVHFAERSGAETVAQALTWLQTTGTRPAFFWVHLWEPHAPYQPPAEFAHLGDRYQGEVATVDAAVGKLVDGIRAAGRTPTIVVTSDHGEGLGEHGEPTHGIFLYRATMEVPLVVAGPGLAAGKTVDAPVSVADIAPTLLDLAGLTALPGADGVSFAAALRGTGELGARGVFAQADLPQIEFGWSGLRAFVTPDAKLVDAPRPELFDRRTDRAETKDLAKERASELRAAQAALAAAVERAHAAVPAQSAEREASAADVETLRGLGYVASGRRTSAESPLIDTRAPDPKDRANFLARFDEATAMTERGEAAAALPLFAELDRIDPRNPGFLQRYGEALILARDLEKATRIFRRAVEVDPGFAIAWYRLGQLLDAAKDLPGAEAAYRRAAQVDPLAIDPRKALAGLLADTNRIPQAIEVLEDARRLDPRDPAIPRDIERYRTRAR